jgi:Spy/CpxP family protein refolding chaperone
MKRTFVTAFALAFTLVAAAVIAQERHMMMGTDQSAAMERHASKLAETLQLAPDQKIAFDSLHKDLAAIVEPLLVQAQTAHAQLHSLLTADRPDATAIGNQLLAVHAIEKQIDAAHKATAQKVEALLTPDQKAKFEALQASHTEHMGAMVGHAMVTPCQNNQ